MDGFGVVYADSERWAGRVKLEGLGQLDTYYSPAFSPLHLGVYQCDDLCCTHVKFPGWNASGLGG